MLQWTLERLTESQKATGIVVATSKENTDYPIAEFCQEEGWSCFRGSLEKVTERFAKVVNQEGIESFVRKTVMPTGPKRTR
jgi:spore coat polysaccharide biosynthesis protein SpsF (cytidylyltransferase family)